MNEDRAGYEKAINICLPAARGLKTEANKMLNKVSRLLGQETKPPVYVLFGANNSGGTATKDGLSLGLEVVCRFAETEGEFREVLLGFIAHEVVHVYQSKISLYSRVMVSESPTLLKRSLVEGVADFVSFLVLGKVTKAETERHEYGLENESKVWTEFQQRIHTTEIGDWLYRQGKSGKPNDMGYWVGKRIAENYYDNAQDKTKALVELLLLEDPVSILTKSGYNPKKN